MLSLCFAIFVNCTATKITNEKEKTAVLKVDGQRRSFPNRASTKITNRKEKTAVLAVDVQKTFYPDGSLAVTGSNATIIMEFINKLHKEHALAIISTKDSHPLHISQVKGKGEELTHWEETLNITILDKSVANFQAFSFIDPKGITRQQISWPVHGLKGGKYNDHGFWEGDDLLPGLDEISTYIQLKGENPLYDSYSGFSDDGGHKTGLETYLKTNGFTQLIVVGEAGNYCVKASILDALTAGFKVIQISDMTHYIPESAETETIHEIQTHANELGGDYTYMTSRKLLEKDLNSDFFERKECPIN
jgi:nicotinamidase/pyrazinamidase